MYVLNTTNTFSKAFKSPAAEVTYIIINIKTEILVIFFVCVCLAPSSGCFTNKNCFSVSFLSRKLRFSLLYFYLEN